MRRYSRASSPQLRLSLRICLVIIALRVPSLDIQLRGVRGILIVSTHRFPTHGRISTTRRQGSRTRPIFCRATLLYSIALCVACVARMLSPAFRHALYMTCAVLQGILKRGLELSYVFAPILAQWFGSWWSYSEGRRRLRSGSRMPRS